MAPPPRRSAPSSKSRASHDLLMPVTEDSAPETLTQGATLVREGLVVQVFDLSPTAQLTCRWSADDNETVLCKESVFSVGVGAFGEERDACRERYGEFVAVAGAAAYLPADGSATADFLMGSDARPVELHARRHLTCEGGFAHLAQFEPMPPRTTVTLSEVAAACLQVTRANAAGSGRNRRGIGPRRRRATAVARDDRRRRLLRLS